MTEENNLLNEEVSSERRSVLIGAGMLGAGALASAATVSSAFAGDHKHSHKTGGKHARMVALLHECIRTGDVCIQHCLMEFKAGDTAMADCAKIVLETGAFCTAHARMATLESTRMKEMCELSIKMCSDCEKECRKHEKKHASCKDCADACAACIKECKAFLKA
ncbi:MAG: Csp1 family four helix bundle copper storage protein [Mariprofundaceae bacterium]|nr:Csp1 family four helix bundle copper storage protein [Mariprofundaceae bacterium]